jgi:hypothetical protein
VVHQIGVQTQGLPTACCLCTTQISRTATPRPLPRCRVWAARRPDSDDCRCQRHRRTSVGLEPSWLERMTVNPLVKRCFQAQKTFGCAGGSTPNPMETTPRNISGVLMRCEAGFQRLGPNARGAAERSPGGCGSRDLVVVRLGAWTVSRVAGSWFGSCGSFSRAFCGLPADNRP